MPHPFQASRRIAIAILLAATSLGASAEATRNPAPATKPLDHSGHKRVGYASYYHASFAGRTMADGTPMRLESDTAASRTLPLGTIAQVTNLADGKSAIVTIRDRGPYIDGRIIDLSPRVARQLGMLDEGVVRVEVAPISIPQPGGGIKFVVAEAAAIAADPMGAPLR